MPTRSQLRKRRFLAHGVQVSVLLACAASADTTHYRRNLPVPIAEDELAEARPRGFRPVVAVVFLNAWTGEYRRGFLTALQQTDFFTVLDDRAVQSCLGATDGALSSVQQQTSLGQRLAAHKVLVCTCGTPQPVGDVLAFQIHATLLDVETGGQEVILDADVRCVQAEIAETFQRVARQVAIKFGQQAAQKHH